MSAEPTAEQLRQAMDVLGWAPSWEFAELSGVQQFDVRRVAGALAAAVTAEREKVRKVLQLHTRDLDGGRDEEYWICQECDRAWPCRTVTLLREVSS